MDITLKLVQIEAECSGKTPDAAKIVRLLAEALDEPCRNADRNRAHHGAMQIAMHAPRLKAMLHDKQRPEFQNRCVGACFKLPDAHSQWAVAHVLHFAGVHMNCGHLWPSESYAAQSSYTMPEPVRVTV